MLYYSDVSLNVRITGLLRKCAMLAPQLNWVTRRNAVMFATFIVLKLPDALR